MEPKAEPWVGFGYMTLSRLLAGGTKTVAPLRGSGPILHTTQRSAFDSTLGYHCSALLHPVTRNTGA
jgi:hypothetical protein